MATIFYIATLCVLLSLSSMSVSAFKPAFGGFKKFATGALVAGSVFSTVNFPASSSPSLVSIAHADSQSVFVGDYDDPNHPGCMRKITVKGKDVTILGSDKTDGSAPWTLKAKEDYPGTIFVDFSPKGGPKDLLGVWDEKKIGIEWPDGNLWKKM